VITPGLKLLLLALVGYVLYDQVIMRQDVDTIMNEMRQGFSGTNWIYLVLCIVLMPINWLVESIKWRTLVLPWKEISLSAAVKAIYAGISVGLVTPARIGEYGGRLLLIEGDDKTKSIPATLVSSVSQNLSNVIGGYIGYDRSILHRVLALSHLRYLIYCTQYVLILYFLGIELSVLAAFSGVAVVIPALLGLLIVLNVNTLKSSQNDEPH